MNSFRSTVRVWAIAFTIAFVACKPASPLPPIALGHPPLVSGVAALINRFGFELYDGLRDYAGQPTRLASSMVLRTMWTTDTVEKQKLFSTAGGSVPVEVEVQLSCRDPYAYAHLDGVQLLQIPSGDCPVNDRRALATRPSRS